MKNLLMEVPFTLRIVNVYEVDSQLTVFEDLELGLLISVKRNGESVIGSIADVKREFENETTDDEVIEKTFNMWVYSKINWENTRMERFHV